MDIHASGVTEIDTIFSRSDEGIVPPTCFIDALLTKLSELYDKNKTVLVLPY